jgi:glycosyltransferase involved in cell wall biosynthesis
VRQSFSIELDAPLVGTVAVFRTQKRLDQWLVAARLLAERHPGVRFLLVGDGPLRGELEAIARRAGLAERVVFAGLQQDVRPYYAALDVFLLSSEFEGLPLALLEAMAGGLPVVATAVGGVPEAIESGTHGLLVPFGAPALLSQAVSRLLGDPELRARLGENARERVRRDFSVERMARELETIYGRIAERRAISAV